MFIYVNALASEGVESRPRGCSKSENKRCGSVLGGIMEPLGPIAESPKPPWKGCESPPKMLLAQLISVSAGARSPPEIINGFGTLFTPDDAIQLTTQSVAD